MGWCSGTEVFDAVCKVLLEEDVMDKRQILKTLIDALENLDWDCQGDSRYWEHPLVREIFKELGWFDTCSCGENATIYGVDPYIEDVFPEDEQVPEGWCEECYQDRRDSI